MDDKNTPVANSQVQTEKKPDDKTGLLFTSHLKITDPNTKEVLAQMRAD